MHHRALKILIAILGIVITLTVTNASALTSMQNRSLAPSQRVAEGGVSTSRARGDSSRRSNPRLLLLPLRDDHDVDLLAVRYGEVL